MCQLAGVVGRRRSKRHGVGSELFLSHASGGDAQPVDTLLLKPGWGGNSNLVLDLGAQASRMLHCNMTNSTCSHQLLLALEDLAAEVLHARRRLDLAQLATLCYCEIRPWARCADERLLAEMSWALCIQCLPLDKAAFLNQVDLLIEELEHTCERAGLPEVAGSLRHARVQ